jgi:hypothetical protein
MTVYRQTFKVSGWGEFPLDMLRYDHCWPSSETEARSSLTMTHMNENFMQKRDVSLSRYVFNKKEAPTLGRWKSFGWNIVEGSLITDKLP